MDNKVKLTIEQFEYLKLDSQFSVFDISHRMVIFFDLENNNAINQYIKSNLESLKLRFEVNRNFIYIPSIKVKKVLK